jgi:hypothetical protein
MKRIASILAVILLTSCSSLSIVSPPSTPSGPVTGKVGQKLEYSTKGTDPLNVHEYMFDWGDETAPVWKSDTSQSHVFLAPRTYIIRAKEKCPAELFVTDWSKARSVKIQPK